MLATVAAGVGLVAAVDVPPDDGARSAAEALLPPDGSASVLTYADGSEWTIESAYSTGLPFLLQQPNGAGGHQSSRLDAAGQDAGQTRFWRQTWTDHARQRGQLVELYELADDGVRQLTITGGQNGFSFSPGVLVLPSDIQPGSTWSSEGDSLPGGLITYTSTGSAEAADDGCLLVTLTMDHRDPAQADATVLETVDRTTWCPGRGGVDSEYTSVSGGETTDGGAVSVPLTEPEPLDAATETPNLDIADAEDWTVSEMPLVIRDPLFGESTIHGATDSRSVMTASGVAVINTGPEIVAYRQGEGESVREWIAHPGGEIVRLGAFGDVVLVSTTDRIVQAYDDRGRRGWRATFADIVQAPPVADGEGGVLLVGLDGEVRRVDLEDGDERWSVKLSGDADAAPAVADGRVFTADRSGVLRAFALDDGSPLWETELERGALITADEERVFVTTDDGNTLAWDAETGEPRWTSAFDGSPVSSAIIGSTLVVQGADGTTAYSLQGDIEWSIPASAGLIPTADAVLLLDSDEVLLVDEAGTVRERWNVGEADAGRARTLLPSNDGVWLLSNDFSVTEVGAP